MELENAEIDILRELASMGANSAGTALGQMLGAKVGLISPAVRVEKVERAKDSLSDPAQMVGAIYVQVFEQGSAFLITFPKKDAFLIIDMLLMRKPGKTAEYNEMEQSAFSEMGNIISAAYLNSVANFLHTKISQGVPGSTVDMVGAVVDAAIVQIATVTDRVLITHANFSIGNKTVDASIYFLFEPSTVKKLLEDAKRV